MDKMSKKEMTGYPSVDKPWLKYYDGDFEETDIPEMSIYQFARSKTLGNDRDIAIDMRFSKNDFKRGIKIPYKKLFNFIENSAKASKKLGIKENEIVPIILPNIPEARVMIYSNSILGATSYPMSPFIAPNQLDAIISENGIKNLVIFHPFYEKYKNILENSSLENIIISTGTDCFPFVLRKLASTPKLDSRSDKIVLWSEYMDGSREVLEKVEPYFDKNHVAAIVGTSGTTGIPKGVMVTDKNLNTVATGYANTGVLEGRFCDALIPSISYGLSLLHYQTSTGTYTYLIPELVNDKIAKLLVNLDVDSFAGGPIHSINLVRSDEFKRGQIPQIKDFISGGASLSKDVEKDLNRIDEGYNEDGIYNPDIIVRQGYALTESTAYGCYNKRGAYKFGTIGIPFPYETVSIFKPDTDLELPYGMPGEICISGPATMAGYLNNEEETEKVLKVHSDGRTWIHTKDIGYMDDDGHLHHVDRIKDIFMRSGFNVHPSKITEFINCLPEVKESVVIGIDHPKEQCVPVAFIVLEDTDKSIDEVKEQISKECYESLEECSVPYDYVFVDELPINLGGKIDKPKILQKAKIDFSKENKIVNNELNFKQE